MSEIKIVECFEVNGKFFYTRGGAELHLEREKIISLIKSRCSDSEYMYSSGTLYTDSIDGLVNMLHDGGFKIVEDNTQ